MKKGIAALLVMVMLAVGVGVTSSGDISVFSGGKPPRPEIG